MCPSPALSVAIFAFCSAVTVVCVLALGRSIDLSLTTAGCYYYNGELESILLLLEGKNKRRQKFSGPSAVDI